MKKLGFILTKFIEVFGAVSLVAMVSLVFYNAALRYFFNSSLPVSEELARFAFVWLCFMGAIIAFKEGAHVSVTLVTERLKGKVFYTVYIIKTLIVVVTIGLMLYGSYNYTIRANWPAPATNIPFWYIGVSLTIMLFCFSIIIIINIVNDIKTVKSGGSLYEKVVVDLTKKEVV